MLHKPLIIYNTGWFWTTIEHRISESESDIAAKCDIALIYLGKGCYSVVKKNYSSIYSVGKSTPTAVSIGETEKCG